ncbi:MAG: M56 family metallopeptidase [Roseburia sp.]|nr:M56 family metallopeptidase [Roseburia sp.]
MNTFLIQLGSMSLQASVAILVVLVLRKIFAMTGVSKKYVMFLWMMPFLLLVCPWKVSVPVGFWNAAPSDYNAQYAEYAMERWAESLIVTERGQVQMSADEDEEIDNVAVYEPGDAENTDTEYHIVESDMFALKGMLKVATCIWAVGLIAFLLYAAVSYALLKKKMRCCVQKEDGIYCVDDLPVPMVVGFLRPQIYLPSGMAEEYVAYVVEHEKTHIRRNDPITKLAAYVIACVHWFNPLVWLAYHLLEKDMEMTCDEETLQRIGTEQKKAYATALVQLSVGTRRIFAVPLAFGEGDTKGRIKNVMHYKKTVRAAAILAVAAGLLVLAIFMTKQEKDADFVMTNDAQGMLDTQLDELARVESEMLEQQLKLIAEQERLEQKLVEQEKLKAEQGELTFDMVRTAAENYKMHELDFHSYTNGEEKRFDDGALNYYINFDYEYEGEAYRLGVSCEKETDKVSDIYITRISDSEQTWLYTDDLSRGYTNYPNDLETFLVTKNSVDDWLSVELPEGYTLGEYQANLGIAGGALISPQAYELYGDDVFAPEDWYYAGFVGQIPNASEYYEFANGKMEEGYVPLWNHSSYEWLGVLDLDWQAMWVQYNHDLYTAAGQAWLEEDGVDISQIDTTSDYWYFFFAKEGEEKAYYLSLSSKLFTKEEALAIAETVDIKE